MPENNQKQKIEIELASNIAEVIKILSSAFHWTPEVLIAVIIDKEIDYIKTQIEFGEVEFLEDLFQVSEIKQELLETLETCENPKYVLEIPNELMKRVEDLCKLANYDPNKKIISMIERAVGSAEVVDDGKHKQVENF